MRKPTPKESPSFEDSGLSSELSARTENKKLHKTRTVEEELKHQEWVIQGRKIMAEKIAETLRNSPPPRPIPPLDMMRSILGR